MTAPRDYGPVQLATRLGLARWQVDRAVAGGLIPPADRPRGRWSAAVVEQAAGRVEQIRAAVGGPDVGAYRAAEVLAERFARPVFPDTVVELARLGLLAEAGEYKGHPLYCGRSLERFADPDALDLASRQGRLRTAEETAAYLGIRRCDLDHLVAAGWLEPARTVRSAWQSRRARPKVALFRTGDLDVLAEHPAIDWEQVRATPPGRPSPLARLTTHRRGRS